MLTICLLLQYATNLYLSVTAKLGLWCTLNNSFK